MRFSYLGLPNSAPIGDSLVNAPVVTPYSHVYNNLNLLNKVISYLTK
jgi:hypothetical protein